MDQEPSRTRRRLLRASGAALAVPWLSGCSALIDEDELDDDGNDRDAADDDEPDDDPDDDEPDADDEPETDDEDDGFVEEEPDYGGFMDGVENYEATLDYRGEDTVEIAVGAGETGLQFEPPAILIDPGTEVVWEWTGEGGEHDVASRAGEEFESELTDEAGFTFEHAFESEGTISAYVCTPHEAQGKKGVVVTDGEEIEQPPDLDGEDDEAEDEEDEEGLTTDPDEDDFVDMTGEETVEVETRQGDDGEPQFLFDPPFVRVDEGTTVRWINTDGVFHTVTASESLDGRSPSGEFDETLSSTGDTFEWTADEPGRQDYYCAPHVGFMFGSIDVV